MSNADAEQTREVVVQVVVDFRYKQDNYTMLPSRRLGGFENKVQMEKNINFLCHDKN